MIQGVPLGLTFGSVPFLLQESASFRDIGIFSLAAYPYSLKLFWSPVVDAIFFKGVGRRKSWILPIQLIVGIVLILCGSTLEGYISHGAHSSIRALTLAFFFLVALVATQDIAVDGWAITMLSKKNRSLASTCQSVGQNLGYFMSYTVFLALNSQSFCNTYLRDVPGEGGMVSLQAYMSFWGAVMIIVTVLIYFLKHEPEEDGLEHLSIASTYNQILQIISLRPMRWLIAVLLTTRLAFSTADAATVLKLAEKGFPRETMAFMVLLSFPFDVAIPIFIARWTRVHHIKPMSIYMGAYPVRMLLTLVGAYIVYWFPSHPKDHNFWCFAVVFLAQLAYSLFSNAMFVSQCAFFAEISDEKIGGTYMTLVNTLANLGGTWPKFFVLWLVDVLTVKVCDETAPVNAAEVTAPTELHG